MSKRWGGDYVVTEHHDLQANTMAVDAKGTYVLLAGRRCFAIKNLDEEADNLKKFHRQSKYEVGSAEWNPVISNSHLCAVSSNNRVEIVNFENSTGYELQPIHSLRAHTRVISGLNWHPKEPDIIATCSIDTFIHIWDLRDVRKPCLSFSAVAGASQVTWNVLSTNLFATAHDGDIKIWDQRKGNSPIQYIAAHLTKIHGLDWCPFQQNHLASSSQDCTVKIFDTNNPRRAESILTSNSPVWRARYTPFGEGLVTIVVPQLRKGENSLLLWNVSNLTSPIYTFVGHTDVVLEFQWRHKNPDINMIDSSDYELITWSKDQCLRVYSVGPYLKKLCGCNIDDGSSVYSQFSENNNIGPLQSVQDLQFHESHNEHDINVIPSKYDKNNQTCQETTNFESDKEISSPTQPKTLQQEFSLINMNIPNIQLNAMDAVERTCTVTACNKNYNVVIKVNFPPNYPYNAQPTFQFCSGTTIDHTTVTKLTNVLKQTAYQRVKKNRTCLESCLRQLIATLDNICKDESENNRSQYHIHHQQNYVDNSNMCKNYQDSYIPFPRTSGAKFCSNGILVCFGRTQNVRKNSVKPENVTPRALAALGANNVSHYNSIYPNYYAPLRDNISISSFYYQEPQKVSRRQHSSSRQQSKPSYRNFYSVVTVYDVSALFFINKELADKYMIDSKNVQEMCQHNASVAAGIGRSDIVQAWYLIVLVLSQAPNGNNNNSFQSYQMPDNDIASTAHPFGQHMIHSLIQHYADQSDIQTAGMLSCAFNSRSENLEALQNRILSKSVNVSRLLTGKWALKPGESPYHTIHLADTIPCDRWNVQNQRHNRSNSWSESLDDIKNVLENYIDYDRNARYWDEKNVALYDRYKKAYADVLYRWKLLHTKTQILKHLSVSTVDASISVEFHAECTQCDKSSRGLQCSYCKKLIFQCSICHLSVRGPSNVCIVCGHGGHTQHLQSWFLTETMCPTGCGCCCIQESTTLFQS